MHNYKCDIAVAVIDFPAIILILIKLNKKYLLNSHKNIRILFFKSKFAAFIFMALLYFNELSVFTYFLMSSFKKIFLKEKKKKTDKV